MQSKKFLKFFEADVKYGMNFQNQEIRYQIDAQDNNLNSDYWYYQLEYYSPRYSAGSPGSASESGEINVQNYNTTFQNFLPSLTARLDLNRDFDTMEEAQKFFTDSVKHNHVLQIEPAKLTQKTQPKPFNTASLLQQASNLYRMSAKDIMACCQHLYQQGHITYMRTDSKKYSSEFIQEAKQWIMEQYNEEKYIHPQIDSFSNHITREDPEQTIKIKKKNE